MHPHRNTVKTTLLFAGMAAFIMSVSWLLFGRNYTALLVGLAVSLGVNFFAYWKSDTLAIKAMRARPVSKAEQPVMYEIVRELSAEAGRPMPRLYVSPTQAPNAFATGRNPKNSAVCCTQGLLQLLDRRELRAVLGHELMHVYNRDVLSASVAAALASVVTSLGYAALFFGDDERPNPVALILLMLLGPIAAAIISMAISRTREYAADEQAAALTGDPLALASALRKLEIGVQQRPLRPERDVANASAMMIANPFSAVQARRLTSTHPPMSDRIARLEKLAAQRFLNATRDVVT